MSDKNDLKTHPNHLLNYYKRSQQYLNYDCANFNQN